MHDQVLVGVADRIQNRVEQAQALRQPRRVACGVVEQGQTIDMLECKPGLALLGLAAIEQVRDVGMIEAGEDLSFLTQAAQAVGGRKAAQDLDRDALLEAAIDALGEKNRAHAAGAEFAQQPIRAKSLVARCRQ